MKTTLLPVALAGAVAFALGACHDPADDVPDPVATAPAAAPATAPTLPAPPPAADAMAGARERSALGVLNAINEHEIAAGEQALAKGVTGDVAVFARTMLAEHGTNRDQTSALGPDVSGDALAQAANGRAELDRLGKADGEAYAAAYVQAMVSGHADALAALDNTLIPAATTEAARAHLQATRDLVAHHLEMARKLQAAD